ncbi:DUF3987 domain-containing protein [Oxalobacter sp. OttesenSCG-928-P03]|nr:DUF3987 domain-containing protein [Oxalobacter sp. OttesenSCG-928-P03]
MKQTFPPYYPVSSLPKILQDVVLEVQYKYNFPMPMIANAVLSAAFYSVQQHNDLEWRGKPGPLIAYFLSIVETGGGKSLTDLEVMKAINDKGREDIATYLEKDKAFKVDHPLWKSVDKGLEEALRRKTRAGKNHEAELKALEAHRDKEPQKPILKKQVINDSTKAALEVALSGNGKSLILVNDEAATVVEKLFLQGAPTLTSVWSAKDFSYDRKTTESGISINARLTMNLSLQPSVMLKAMKQYGNDLVGSGLLPRCFIAFPDSTIGQRLDRGEQIKQDWQEYIGGLDRFYAYIAEKLRVPEERDAKGNIVRRLLRFTTEAQYVLREIWNDYEAKQGINQIYFNIRPFASRFTEQTVRLAGLFHLMNGGEGDIPAEVVRQAHIVQSWYANEVLRLFGQQQLPEYVSDALLLLSWLREHFRINNGQAIRKNILYQRGPNAIRLKARMNAALDYLVPTGHIWIDQFKKALYVYPGPNLYGPLA